MSGEKNSKSVKLEIKKVLDGFMEALSTKNIRDIMGFYAPDVIVFDVKPPMQIKGAVAWRHVWEASLPFFPQIFKVEVRDLNIYADGNTALAHYFFRLTGPEKEHPAMQTWMRATTGYKLLAGKWKIIHEHASLPFNPINNEVVFTQEF